MVLRKAGSATIRNLRRRLDRIYEDPARGGSFSGLGKLFEDASEEIPGLKRSDVRDYLRSKKVATTHSVPRKRFPRRKILSMGKNEHWSADLAVMEEYLTGPGNGGIKYWLVVVDTLTRYCYAEPAKTKTGYEISRAFEKILKRAGTSPKKLQTDRGGEFYNSYFDNLCRSRGIERYSTYNYDTKAAIAERTIRTLKGRLHKFLANSKTDRYSSKLNELVAGYNDSYHRTLGATPAEASERDESDLLKAQIGSRMLRRGEKKSSKKPRFKAGDRVRISIAKKTFDKGYGANFSEETFVVNSSKKTDPPTYGLKDDAGEVLGGKFYAEELRLVG